jgi:succinoglycan biosynthesis protein ExoA
MDPAPEVNVVVPGEILQSRRLSARRGVNILIVIPALNEEAHIEDVIRSLQSDLGCSDACIVLADGGSRDATVSIVEGLAAIDSRVIAMGTSQPLGISASINRAVERFGRDLDWLVRIDAHAEYPPNYVSQLVETATARGATAVVTTMASRGITCFQQAAAASQNSFLGTGGSAHRMKLREGRWVEHGHHALLSLKMFAAVGGYDETFSHNEDAELDHRILNAGGRIWLEPRLALIYYPRKTLWALARQYFKYGSGRAMTVARHPRRRRARQVIPLAIAPVCCFALLTPVDWRASLPALSWAVACLIYGGVLGLTKGGCATAAGVAAIVMQAAWSFGYWKQVFSGRGPGAPPTRLRFQELQREAVAR